MEKRKIGKNEDAVLGVKVILVMEKSDDIELDLSSESQKVIFSVIYNMFKGKLDFKPNP